MVEWDDDHEELDQFDAASSTDTLDVGGPNGLGKPRRRTKTNRRAEGSTLVPEGGEYGGAGYNSKGQTRTGVEIDSRGRAPFRSNIG